MGYKKKEGDWITKAKIKDLRCDPLVEDVDAFINSFNYWVVKDGNIDEDVKVRLLVSRLVGEAAAVGEELAVLGKTVEEILKTLKIRYGKSLWQIMEEMTRVVGTTRDLGNEEYAIAIKKVHETFPENYKKHPDFSLFLLLYLGTDVGYRRKVLGEYFIKCVKDNARFDTNSFVGKVNFAQGIEQVQANVLVPIKEEPIDISNINKKIRCYYCNKLGHIKSQCFKYKNDKKTTKNVSNIFVDRSEESYVDLKIENKALRGLVDTGASLSVSKNKEQT